MTQLVLAMRQILTRHSQANRVLINLGCFISLKIEWNINGLVFSEHIILLHTLISLIIILIIYYLLLLFVIIIIILFYYIIIIIYYFNIFNYYSLIIIRNVILRSMISLRIFYHI